jgi:penicillin-binding protein 1A
LTRLAQLVRIAQLLLAALVVAVLAAAVGVAFFYALILRELPELDSLDDYRPNLITRVYAADGAVIGELALERREIVAIEQVPQFLVHAFVAAEDDSFYTHDGLDYAGITRAFWANLRAGGIKQGGSTITQQVAKTFLLSSDRTYIRKLKDMVLAKRIEEHLDKNEILYLYLNQIYLGSGAYGVEAAAQTYFGKSVDELSLAEAALIAGVVPAPSRYSPFRNPEFARTRQVFVLRRMEEEGYISPEQHQAALEEPTVLVERTVDENRRASAYFTEEVRRYLVQRFGPDEVLTGGLSVRTTLRVRDQRAAYSAVRAGLRDHDRRRGYRGPKREVPEQEWGAALEAIAEANGEGPWKDGAVLEALAVEVDDEEERIRLALGGGRETTLLLDDVAWAREPDAEVDGLATKLDRVSQALQPGDLVELEKTGEKLVEGEVDPVPTFALFQEPLTEGALVAYDVTSSEVRALIGGYSFDRSQFDRAVQSRRQPGSAFKPIVYAAALQEGYTPATIVYDTPFVSSDTETGFVWKPQNYSEKFYGPILLREALAKSRNLATIKILHDIGLKPVVRMAKAIGMESPLGNELGVGLGHSETTLAELVRVYGTFASGGRRLEPIFIREVRGRDGELLDEAVPLLHEGIAQPGAPQAEEREGSSLEQVLSEIRADVGAEGQDDSDPGPDRALEPEIAFLMTDLLRAVVQEGTGWRAKALKRPVAGKTGTTNLMNDAWFIGFTPEIVAGAWVGYDVAQPLGKNESGSRAASPVFVDFMQRVTRGDSPSEFRVPEGIIFIRMDRKSGLLAPPGLEDYVFQPFREGNAPTEIASVTGNGTGPAIPRLD